MPLKLSFSLKTDLGIWKIVAGDTLEEICDLLPIAIQNIGAGYRLMKILGPEEWKMTLSRKDP